MNVSDPIDRADMTYAIETIVREAYANGIDKEVISDVLESSAYVVENSQYPFEEFE